MELKDKIVLITGASRGIGAATAIRFAKEGAKVVINYKNSKEQAEEVLKKIGGKEKGIIIQADISVENEVKKLVQDTIKTYGTIDILINNAGEIIRPGDWNCDESVWQKTMDVNLKSMWLVTKAVAPIMQKNKKGAIVNLTSTVGILGSQYVLPYSCSKGAIISLTKSFAKELAPFIRVNAVAPSNVMTDMTKSAGEELIEKFKQSTPLKRIAEPEELASAILFLASDEASYITGEVLVVDGGYTLK